MLLPSPDTTEVITIITQKRKGRSSICKTIFHLHICMTYFCFIKYKNLSNWKLLFQLSRYFFFLVEFFFPCKNNCCIIPINLKLVTSCNSFSYLIPQTKPIKIFQFQAILQPLSLIHCLYTLYPEESHTCNKNN